MSMSVSRVEFEERQERARRAAAARGWDALLVIGRAFYDRPGNLAYYTNHFPPFPTTQVSGGMRGMGHGVLVLPVNGRPLLVVDGLNYRDDLVAIDDILVDRDLPAGVAGILQSKGLTTAQIGLVGEDVLPVLLFRELAERVPGVSWVPADALAAEQRMIKSPAERDLLRQAARVALAGLEAAQNTVGLGVRERDVCAAGTAAALAAGADFVRYLRVHSGPWSAWGSRWPPATDRVMARGDLVTLDIIGAAQGYAFDVLRTTIVGFDTLPEQRRMCNAVLKALVRTLDACRPGVIVDHLVRRAHRILEESGYGHYASAFVGHGIGLETVEGPLLTPGVQTVLEPGMVLCIEPSVYIPDWGGCSIEEEIIVTDEEPAIITKFPRRLWE